MAGNFWRRPKVEQRWPVEAVLYRTEPEVQVLVHAQRPVTPSKGQPKGEIIIVHGLEGSSLSGYARSMAYAALDRGYSAGRLNLRGCGGTEHLAITSYHAGQTSDVLAVLRERREASGQPLFLAGFSLGGNIALKLAGELGDSARDSSPASAPFPRPSTSPPAPPPSNVRKTSFTRTASSLGSRTAFAAGISRRPSFTRSSISPKSAPSPTSTITTRRACSVSAPPPTISAPNPRINSSSASGFRRCWYRPRTTP